MIRVRKPNDHRIKVLASELGVSREEALGRLINLWGQCLDECRDSLEPASVRAHLGPNGVEALVSSGLGRIAPGAVQVAGARDEIGQRERRTEAARRAGLASGVVRGGTTDRADGPPNERDVRVTSTPSQRDVNATSTPSERPLSSSDLGSDLFSSLKPSSETPRDLKQQRVSRSRPKHPMPPDFEPSDSDREYANQNGLDPDLEVKRCRDRFASKGEGKSDWQATYRNWLRDEVRYKAERAARFGSKTSQPRGQVQAAIVQRQDGEHDL